MADFYGALLTTSFRVKDPAAYAADPIVQYFLSKAQESRFGVELPKTPEDYTAIGFDGQYPGSADSTYTNGAACKTCGEKIVTEGLADEVGTLREHLAQHHGGAYNLSTDEVEECFDYAEMEVEYNLTDAIEKHIHPDDVCVLQVSGQEKLRYVGGEIAFITSKGTVWFPFGSNAWDNKMNKNRVQDLLGVWDDQMDGMFVR